MPDKDEPRGLYGSENATGSWPLLEGAGQELNVDESGRATSVGSRTKQAKQPGAGGSASMSGPMPNYGKREARAGMGGSDVAAPKKVRQRAYTNEELSHMADQMAAAMAAQHKAQLAAGASVAPVGSGQTPALQDAYAAQQARTADQFQTGPQQQPPPWLSGYMAQQPQGNPYAPIPPPIQMTPQQRDAYGVQPAHWMRGK